METEFIDMAAEKFNWWIAFGIVVAAAAFVAQFLSERRTPFAIAILVLGLLALALLAYGTWKRH